ncbi:MAG: hypothetical protein ACRBN8_30360 [Nannocystales bacterium]
MNLRLLCVSLVWLVPACGSTGPSAEPVTLDFRAENDLLAGFEQDSGFLPQGSPAAIRVVAGATAALVATAQATAVGDTLTPVSDTGSLAMEAGFTLEVSAKIDAAGVDYEGVIESFEYGIEPSMVSFEPFAVGESVTLESALPPSELARVPVPSVPGATLVVDITGGQVNTAYSGVCAVATGGLAQYTAEAVIDGTIQLEGTIELELLVVTETFGPYPIEVPIPAVTTALDLGTFSTVDGTPAPGSPCESAGADTDAVDPTAASGPMDPTSTESTTGGDPSMGSSGETTSGPTSGSTSGPETGEASSSSGGAECIDDAGCTLRETCVEEQCVPVPSECGDGLDCAACPSESTCSLCVQFDGNACSDVLDDCFFDDDCLALIDCTNPCEDQACYEACAAASTAEAVDLFNSVVLCINGECG